MIRVALLFFIFLGVSMADNIEYLEVRGVKIPVISEKSNAIPIGNLQLVFIGGGSVYNPKNKPLAKVSSEILNKGTKTLGNVKFADLLDSKAIDLDVSIGQTSLTIELNFLKEYEDFAYTQLKNLLSDPNLTTEALDDVKTELHANLLSKQTDFDYQASKLLKETIFANTPLAYPSLGNSQGEIDSITLQDISKYLQDNLVLNRLIIVIGGDLDIHSSLNKIKDSIDFMKEGSKVEIPTYNMQVSSTKTLNKDTQQAYIYFASPLHIKNLKDEGYKARVAGFILGSSGFGSRLMEEIRVKRGLAYSAYMYPNIARLSNYFTGYMQTSLDKREEAIEITRQIVRDFVQNGVTQEELDSAKQFMLGNRPLQEETLSKRLNAKFMNYYNGLPIDYKDEFIKQVENLDLQTLNEYIKSHKEIADLTFAVILK